MISHDTIDEIKNRIDIIDVIGDFVTLKRSGQNYKALSPFTNEKTASFYVVPSKGIFKDFSSGKGGDGITFVMEHEGMSYVEALRYLAKKYGVTIKEDVSSQEQLLEKSDRDSLYIVMNYAKDYYKELLQDSEEGRSIGMSYFRERGFNTRTIEKFELGYSINEWDHFHKKATSAGYSDEMIEKAGLVIKKESTQGNGFRFYDRFRGRVIFPVHNLAGKVIAFGARRTTMPSSAAYSLVRGEVRQQDATMPVYDLKTLEAQLDETLLTDRLIALLSAGFGLLATLLASVGLYGVMAFVVARRKKELGIRLALGAQPGLVIWLVMREVLVLLAIGLAIGIPAAMLLGRYVSSQLYGIQAHDPLIASSTTILLTLVSAAAGLIPAHRASRIDPILALRHE